MPALKAIFSGDSTPLQSEMNKVLSLSSAMASKMGSIFGGIGAATLVKGAVDAADRIRALSQEFKVSYDTVQQWDIAAKRTNQTAEDIGNAFNRIKKARDAALSSGNLGGFAAFNIPMAALKDSAITTEQILERMMEVTSAGITDAQDVAGMELMGKSGSKILSAFRELHDLGPVTLIGGEEIDKMHELQEGFEDFKRQSSSWIGKLFLGGTKGAPAFAKMGRDLIFGAGDSSYKPPMDSPGWNFTQWPSYIKDLIKSRSFKNDMTFDIGSAEGSGGVKADGTPAKLRGPVVEGMSKSQVVEMKRMQLEIAEKIFQNTLKTMTVEEKRAALNKQIKDHMAASDKAFEDANWNEGYKEKLEAEKIKGELLSVKDDAVALSRGRMMHGSLTSLQQQGAYASPASHVMIDTTKKMERHLASIDSKIGRGSSAATLSGVKY